MSFVLTAKYISFFKQTLLDCLGDRRKDRRNMNSLHGCRLWSCRNTEWLMNQRGIWIRDIDEGSFPKLVQPGVGLVDTAQYSWSSILLVRNALEEGIYSRQINSVQFQVLLIAFMSLSCVFISKTVSDNETLLPLYEKSSVQYRKFFSVGFWLCLVFFAL